VFVSECTRYEYVCLCMHRAFVYVCMWNRNMDVCICYACVCACVRECCASVLQYVCMNVRRVGMECMQTYLFHRVQTH